MDDARARVNRVTVFACETQPIVVEGLERVLAASEDLKFAGARSSMEESLEAFRQTPVDIVLIDQSAGLGSILSFVTALRTASSETQPVLWITELADADAVRAVRAGIRGILPRAAAVPVLLQCLREVAQGKLWVEDSGQVLGLLSRKQSSRLTHRELEVARLVCQGLRNKEIATALHITPGTVKVHLMHIFEKTGLQNRFALALHGRTAAELAAPATER
jgi:DNA-binding NarL/FixJ family response regulator